MSTPNAGRIPFGLSSQFKNAGSLATQDGIRAREEDFLRTPHRPFRYPIRDRNRNSRDRAWIHLLEFRREHNCLVPLGNLRLLHVHAVRFLRTRIVLAERTISPLCPEGEAGFHRAFRGLTAPAPQVAFIAVVALISTIYFQRLFLFSAPLYEAMVLITILLWGTAFGSVFWLHAHSLMSLYDLGTQPLKLRPYHDDLMLGARPLGSLSLNLTFIFLSLPAVGAIPTSFYATTTTTLLLLGFATVGVSLFFLPLSSIHRKMREVKNHESSEIAIRRREFLQSTTSEAGAESSMARIEKILSLEFAERRIDRIRTWPFDTEIIGTLTAIFLSVVATFLAFLLTTFLNL